MQLWAVALSCLILGSTVETNQGFHRLGENKEGKINQNDVIKMQLIKDYIEQIKVKHNIAILANHHDAHLFTTRLNEDYTDEIFTVTVFILDSITEELVVKMKNIHIKDNFPSIYIIIQPEDKTEQLITEAMQKIKAGDAYGRITVIYYEEVNVNEMFKDQQIYDIYLFNPKVEDLNQTTVYREFGICMFCDKGADMMTHTNTWRFGQGFIHTVKLARSFTGKFHGHEVTMGIGRYIYPNIYPKGIGKDGNYILTGMAYNYYVVLGGMLNLRWRFKATGDIMLSGRKYLEAGRVDVLGNLVVGSIHLYQFLDFSAPEYYFYGFSIISVEPLKGIQWYGYITVFPWYTWVAILLSIPAVGVTLYFLRRFDDVEDERIEVEDAMWDGAQIMMWDGIKQPRPSCGMIILLSTYMMMVFLIVSFYMGEYTAVLTTPKHVHPPIDSLEQLWQSNMNVLAVFGFHKLYLTDYKNVDGIKGKIKNFQASPGKDPFLEALKKLQEYPDEYSVIYDYIAISFIIDKLPNYSRRFYRSKQSLSNLYATLFFPKSSPYKEAFNRNLMTLQEMGFTRHQEETYDTSRALAWEKYLHEPADNYLITFRHFAGGLLIPLVGYSLAALVHLISLLWARYGHHVLL